MKYNDLIKYFESDETLVELLNVLKETFDTIDDYSQQFIADVIQTSEEASAAKTRLTGIIAYLNPIYSKALSLKKQREYRFYVQKKEQCESTAVKFVDGSTEKESKDAVRRYRDIRDLLAGYLKASESLIFDLKDRIEKNKKEYHNEK